MPFRWKHATRLGGNGYFLSKGNHRALTCRLMTALQLANCKFSAERMSDKISKNWQAGSRQISHRNDSDDNFDIVFTRFFHLKFNSDFQF